jgi:hypothetical protein
MPPTVYGRSRAVSTQDVRHQRISLLPTVPRRWTVRLM